VTVAALDALIRDAQRRVGACADRRFLMSDRHIHHHAIEPLDLVRIDTGLGCVLAQAQQQALFALAIAKRARGVELGERNFFNDAQPFRDEADDLAIDIIDAIAERAEVHGSL
jgi:hypothetical protein